MPNAPIITPKMAEDAAKEAFTVAAALGPIFARQGLTGVGLVSASNDLVSLLYPDETSANRELFCFRRIMMFHSLSLRVSS